MSDWRKTGDMDEYAAKWREDGNKGEPAKVPRMWVRNIAYGGARPVSAAAAVSTATWSATNKNANATLSNGNLTATGPGGATFYPGRSDTAILSGDKRYFEITINVISGANSAGSGFCNASETFADTQYLGSQNNGAGYYQDGNVYSNGAVTASFATYVQGDVISWAINGANLAWVRVNAGGWNNDIIANQNPATGTGGLNISGFGNIFPAYTVQSTGRLTAAFGPSFINTLPSGFAGFP